MSFSLDHIIILLPATSLDNLPPAFTKSFTITPGGNHADGKTYNKLVVLSSGVYLEFIAFVDDDPARKAGHWWGRKAAGSVIDWALTSGDVKDVEGLEGYGEPRKGGRERGDGKSVEWFVTFPREGMERGSVPFFCHDVTARELRVPREGAEHACGAVGVESVVVVAAAGKVDEIAEVYTTLLGRPVDAEGRTWAVGEPLVEVEDGRKGSTLRLVEASGEEDEKIVKDNGGVAGVKEITLRCNNPSKDDKIEVFLNDRTIRIHLKGA